MKPFVAGAVEKLSTVGGIRFIAIVERAKYLHVRTRFRHDTLRESTFERTCLSVPRPANQSTSA